MYTHTHAHRDGHSAVVSLLLQFENDMMLFLASQRHNMSRDMLGKRVTWRRSASLEDNFGYFPIHEAVAFGHLDVCVGEREEEGGR